MCSCFGGNLEKPYGKSWGGAPGQKDVAAKSKQWRTVFPGERAEGAKVPALSLWNSCDNKIFRVMVLWNRQIPAQTWRPPTANALQTPVRCLSYTTHNLNHFSHMFRSRHFLKPKWISDTLKASQRGPIPAFQTAVLCLDLPQVYPCWVQNLQVGAQAWVYLMLPKYFSCEAQLESRIYCKAKKRLHTPTYRKFLCPLWFIHL